MIILKLGQKDCELVILVEGSDSFDEGALGFHTAVDCSIDFVEKLYHSIEFDSLFLTILQFSGIKQRIKHYIPGSGGVDHDTGLLHYEKLIGPTEVTDDYSPKVSLKKILYLDGTLTQTQPFDTKERQKVAQIEALGGTDHLYLCLQDVSSSSSFKHSKKTTKFLVIIGDGSWEATKLKSISGGDATKQEILSRAHRTFEQIFTIIGKLASRMNNFG